MIATASAEDYRRTIETIGRAGVADAIIAIFIPPLVTAATEVAAAVSSAAEHIPPEVTLLTVFMADDAAPIEPRRSGRPIPVYTFPEEAARALGHAAAYGRWRATPVGCIPAFDDCRPDEAAAVIARALGTGDGWLAPTDVDEPARLLRAALPGFAPGRGRGRRRTGGTRAGRHGGAQSRRSRAWCTKAMPVVCASPYTRSRWRAPHAR